MPSGYEPLIKTAKTVICIAVIIGTLFYFAFGEFKGPRELVLYLIFVSYNIFEKFRNILIGLWLNFKQNERKSSFL